MYCLVFCSSCFSWDMSRSSLRVFARIRALHFRICFHRHVRFNLVGFRRGGINMAGGGLGVL